MTTFLYTTTSDEVTVTNPDEVEELVSEYYFTVEPTLDGDQFSFYAVAKPNSAFDVYLSPDQDNSCVEEFLDKLSKYIKSDFTVKCVEVQGEGQPAAWSWTVTPSGDVSFVEI